MIKAYSGNIFMTRKTMLLIIVAFCIFGFGCQGPATIWSAEARSPDGLWLATARVQQWSGPGNAYEATTVYLKWIKGTQPPTEILVFSDEYAPAVYVKMEWIEPTHLNVIYAPSSGPSDQVNVDFQAVKCAGIQISIQEVASAAFNTSQ